MKTGAAAPGSVADALALLDRGLAALAALPQGLAQPARDHHAKAVADLMQALRAAPDQAAGKPLLMDPARLTRLLEMAGPAHAPELLATLDQDLARVAQSLDPALQAADAKAIRAQTHILIALAGSIGALGLERLARALNQRAHDTTKPPDPEAADDLRRGLAQLRAMIAERRGMPGAGA